MRSGGTTTTTALARWWYGRVWSFVPPASRPDSQLRAAMQLPIGSARKVGLVKRGGRRLPHTLTTQARGWFPKQACCLRCDGRAGCAV